MLQTDEKNKINEYVGKICSELLDDTRKYMDSGMTEKQIIDEIVAATANRFTPESKMIMSSVYNALMKETLSKHPFDQPQNQSALYEMNLLKDINNKFVFDIPQNLCIEDSKNELNGWIKTGAVVVVGGAISITLKNLTPLCIAVLIAGIMAIAQINAAKNEKQDIYELVKDYLNDVKKSMMLWISTIEQYYDDKISELEKKLV